MHRYLACGVHGCQRNSTSSTKQHQQATLTDTITMQSIPALTSKTRIKNVQPHLAIVYWKLRSWNAIWKVTTPKKMPYFPSTGSRCLSHVACFFRFGVLRLLYGNNFGYTMSWLYRSDFNVVPSVTVTPYGVINVAILRALHATLWSFTLTGRFPTFHMLLRFIVRHAPCASFFPHLSIQGCWILCDGPPSSS